VESVVRRTSAVLVLTSIWYGTTVALVKLYSVYSEITPKAKEGHEGARTRKDGYTSPCLHKPRIVEERTSTHPPPCPHYSSAGASDVHDEKISREQVALAHKEGESYDPSYYETQLVRAVESLLSLLGRGCTDIQRELSEGRVPELADFKGEATYDYRLRIPDQTPSPRHRCVNWREKRRISQGTNHENQF